MMATDDAYGWRGNEGLWAVCSDSEDRRALAEAEVARDELPEGWVAGPGAPEDSAEAMRAELSVTLQAESGSSDLEGAAAQEQIVMPEP